MAFTCPTLKFCLLVNVDDHLAITMIIEGLIMKFSLKYVGHKLLGILQIGSPTFEFVDEGFQFVIPQVTNNLWKSVDLVKSIEMSIATWDCDNWVWIFWKVQNCKIFLRTLHLYGLFFKLWKLLHNLYIKFLILIELILIKFISQYFLIKTENQFIHKSWDQTSFLGGKKRAKRRM